MHVNIHRTVLFLAFLFLAFSGLAVPTLAAPPESAVDECPISKKVSTLLASWKQAGEEMKALSPAEREKLQTRCAALASQCPIGSRLGATLVTAREVLTALKSAEEACGKSCPLAAAAEKGGAKSEACAAGLKLKAARTKLIHDLQLLASHASEACPASACSASAEKTENTVSAPAPGCTKELGDKVAALKSNWEKASKEALALAPEKREAILTGAGALGQSCKALGLVPETFLALGEGFDALETVQGKMAEWGKANPEILQSVPEEAKKSFESQRALIHETRAVFLAAREAMKAMHPPAAEKAAATARAE